MNLFSCRITFRKIICLLNSFNKHIFFYKEKMKKLRLEDYSTMPFFKNFISHESTICSLLFLNIGNCKRLDYFIPPNKVQATLHHAGDVIPLKVINVKSTLIEMT